MPGVRGTFPILNGFKAANEYSRTSSELGNTQILLSPGNVSDLAGTSERAAMTTVTALKVPVGPCRSGGVVARPRWGCFT